MRPNLQVLMTVEQNLYSVIHPVIRKVLKVIFSKAPMASGLLLWLPTAQADPSELEQTAITKHSNRLDEKRCYTVLLHT